MLLIGWFISCCPHQGASHGPLLNALLDGECGENRFFQSNSLGCQQNKPHGRPVPSPRLSFCPSHIMTKSSKSLGEPRGRLQNLRWQRVREGAGVGALPALQSPSRGGGRHRGCSLPMG